MNENRQPNDVTTPRPNPNARWTCGYLHLGMSCTEGPTENGVCCQLNRAKESATEGCNPQSCDHACGSQGECQQTQSKLHEEMQTLQALGPCVPLRTSWFSRQTLALNAAILAGGLLLLAMALPQREATFVPGSLSQKHSQILGNKLVSERCSLCHPNSHPGKLQVKTQDELCMKCHDHHLPDAVLRSPHDLNAEQLQTITRTWNEESAAKRTLTSRLVSWIGGEQPKETSCATCHIEHHGGSHDLKAMADQRCQACHQSQFASFDAGHPEFKDFPYRTNRRIAFDHARHQDRHFAQKNTSFECSMCHVDGARQGEVGSVFRSVGFERACAQCHSQPIESASANGWAVLQMPCLPPEDAANDSFGLGDWPTDALFDYDGQVSLAMRLLLAADPQAQLALNSLNGSGLVTEIPSDVRPVAARSLALAFRALIADTAAQGQVAWQERLTTVLESTTGRVPNANERALIEEMTAGLPPDLFRTMEHHWFGNVQAVAATPKPIEAQLVASHGSAYPDDDLLSEQDDLLSADEDLLASPLDPEEQLDAIEGVEDASPSKVNRSRQFTSVSGMQHLTEGGWYLDKQLMALRYMPRGHGDRTLAAWVQFAALIQEEHKGSSDLAPWHDSELAIGKLVPGGCTECHLVAPAASVIERWQGWETITRPASTRPFTKFDHTPHLTIPNLSDCRYCHIVAPKSENHNLRTILTATRPSDRSQFIATRSAISDYLHTEFVPMERAQCVACHRQGGANQGCTQCHNYHVGSEGFEWSTGGSTSPHGD